MNSDYFLLILFLFAPFLWLLVVVVFAFLVGVLFGISSVFWFGPWNAFITLTESSAKLGKCAPYLIWGLIFFFALCDSLFGIGRNAAIGVLIVYCTVALVWAVVKPRDSFELAFGIGLSMFTVCVLLLHGWGKALLAVSDWVQRRSMKKLDYL